LQLHGNVKNSTIAPAKLVSEIISKEFQSDLGIDGRFL
jgi:hypothetical protein